MKLRRAAMLLALPLVLLAGGAAVFASYRQDLAAIRARVSKGGEVVATSTGPIEYATRGNGAPVLVIHGAGGGYDQGLLIAGSYLADGFKVIAPSRFGYLRTPLPKTASPAAQADAHTALLDALGVGKVAVIGVSAGARSATQLALRYPDRVSALILVVPALDAPGKAPVQVDKSASSRLVLRVLSNGGDLALWLTTHLAPRSQLVRFLGVPPKVEAAASAAERDIVSAMVASLLPLSERAAGLQADAVASQANLGDEATWPVVQIQAPTLIIAAQDDRYNTLPGARYMAERVPGARPAVVYESGGHLLVGRQRDARQAIAEFLAALGLGPKRGA